MTLPCGETIGHGETCSSFWLCSDCQEKLDLIKLERAAVVAWLRKNAELNPHLPDARALVLHFANAIEDGIHHGKATA